MVSTTSACSSKTFHLNEALYARGLSKENIEGSVFKDQQLNPAGLDDLAYMDNVGILMTQGAASPFCLYYNVMEDEGGKPKDKHEFKRFFSE